MSHHGESVDLFSGTPRNLLGYESLSGSADTFMRSQVTVSIAFHLLSVCHLMPQLDGKQTAKQQRAPNMPSWIKIEEMEEL